MGAYVQVNARARVCVSVCVRACEVRVCNTLE